MEQWNEYLEALASKAPTPGGGSAAAVYGAIGTALGEMVGNLTSGKKKFAIYEEDVQKILARLGGAVSIRRRIHAFPRSDNSRRSILRYTRS